MATGIFCTVAEVQRKAGANASATSNVEAYIDDFTSQAESYINCVTGFNWSDTYATENVDVKGILKEAASNLAAIYVLNFDFNSASVPRIEIEDRINVLWARLQECIKILKEAGTNKFIQGV